MSVSYKRLILNKRMIKTADTKTELLGAARQLFAEKGFRGTTVRAIANRAGANIAAVTYHFGSKEKLYHAVLEAATAPVRERLAKTVNLPDPPLDQLENHIRATFAFIHENPDLPRLIFQQLVQGGPLPPPGRETLKLNLDRVVWFIEQGQADGSIGSGEARLMALSIVGQPLLLAIYRDALRETMAVDQDDPAVRAKLVDTVVGFIRSALENREDR
jgi:AcrR family transcriptional regulator